MLKMAIDFRRKRRKFKKLFVMSYLIIEMVFS